jgi:DNA-binding protein HU-beta
VNKTELVETVATHTGIAKSTVAEVLNGFEEVVLASVAAGEKVTVTGFVSFDQVQRKARTARNPQTGEPIQVKASKAPKVSIGATFKKTVKGEEKAPRIRR